MSIGKKLNTSFILLLFLFVITIGVSVFNLNKIKSNLEEALDVRVEQILIVDEIRFAMGMQGLSARQVLIADSPQAQEQLTYYAEFLDEKIEELDKITTTETMNTYLEELTTFNSQFNDALVLLLRAANADDAEQVTSILTGDLKVANDGILEVATKMLDFQDEQLQQINNQSDAAVANSITTSIIIFVIGLIIGIFLIWFVRRKITSPLIDIIESLEVLSTGDLRAEDIKVQSKDEIGQLATTYNSMKNNNRTLLQSIQSSAEHLSASSEELSASTEEITATTEDVTKRVSEAAEAAVANSTAAGESARAVDETAVGVQRIAEATQTLHESSMDTSAAAHEGEEIITDAEGQMRIINESTSSVNEVVQKLSKQIEEIEQMTQVITDITDQTNLLALNASIEAARAGEHGKGFAVVADEVRKLAEGSRESANKIVELTKEIMVDTSNVESAVSDSLQSVNEGVKVIEKAGQSFKTIVQSVDQMTTQIEEISATSEQISASAEEVSASVNEISNGVQGASENVEMIAAAMEEQSATMEQVNHVAEDLSDKAQDLQAEVQKFKI